MPYGLFRTSYSLRSVLNVCHWHTAPHNPAQYSHIVKLTLHFYAHIGAGQKAVKPLLCEHIVVSGI